MAVEWLTNAAIMIFQNSFGRLLKLAVRYTYQWVFTIYWKIDYTFRYCLKILKLAHYGVNNQLEMLTYSRANRVFSPRIAVVLCSPK